MKGTHITPRQVRTALAAAFLLLLLLFLSLFQYQRADTRLEDIAAQNGWDCLGAADRLATHLKRGTYDYMTIDAIARFDETAQHAQQPRLHYKRPQLRQDLLRPHTPARTYRC